MSQAADEGVLLGYEDGEMVVTEGDPLVSRLGGVPVWLGPSRAFSNFDRSSQGMSLSPVQHHEAFTCQNCRQRLFLVAQIDATMEHSSAYRVMYVFGCNTGACQRLSGSWKVVRGQLPKPRTGGGMSLAHETEDPRMSVKTMRAGDDWGIDAGDWGVAAANDWGMEAPTGRLSDLSELEKALNEHELTSLDAEGGAGQKNKKKKGKKPRDEEGPKPSYLQDESFQASSFPAHHLCFEQEPDPVAFKKTLSKHEKELLEQYERDAALSKDTADFGEDLEGAEEAEESEGEQEAETSGGGRSGDAKWTPSKKPVLAREPARGKKEKDKEKGKKKSGGASRGSKSTDGGGDGWGGEEYERFGLKHVEKTLWRFQKRLMVSPTQVIRFPPYGDSPLLYTSDPKFSPPSEDRIPKCPGCGSTRRFEFQVMPNALSLLQKPRQQPASTPAAPASAAPLGSSSLPPRISLEECEGMEWATVLVYTCPLSCGGDSPKEGDATTTVAPQHAKYSEEYVFVQPLL